VKCLRTRVRLTNQDWLAIYAALGTAIDADPGNRIFRRALGKIGARGMAAAARGVAPVRRPR
jgi:hypothetical protein